MRAKAMLFLCIKYDLSIEHLQLLTISSIVALSHSLSIDVFDILKYRKSMCECYVSKLVENSPHVTTIPLYSVHSGNGSGVSGVRWLHV